MQVMAFSTPARPHWRWRIVNYAGEIIEESHESFRTIADAVAEGAKRLARIDVIDRSTPARGWSPAPRRRR